MVADLGPFSSLINHEDPQVKEAYRWAKGRLKGGPFDEEHSPLWPLLLLRKVPIFEKLQVRDFLSIARIASRRRYGPGVVIVREGERGDVLYLVMKGSLRVLKGLDTPEETLLDTIEAGGFFGEMALFDRQPRSASVVSQTDIELMEIHGKTFRWLMEQFPDIPINVCRILSQRVRNIHQLLERRDRSS
jgi:CRP-like cAMP-binding protein